MQATYFDDNVLVDVAATSQQAKQMFQRTFSAFGTPPKESTSFPMQNHLSFLGPVNEVYIILSEASRQQVIVHLQRALDAGIMT